MRTYIAYSICILVLVSWTQDIRTNKEIEQAFLHLDKTALYTELKTMTVNDQLYRNLLDSLYQIGQKPPKKQRDSIWSIQEQIDDHNTRRLLEITEQYGFPNPDRTGKPIPVWLIFQHADEKYCDQLMPILDRELEAKRLTTAEYHMIQWNLNGRKELPFKVVTH